MQQLLEDLGSTCAIIGAQWGDEGKGKLFDMLAAHFDVLARASGGANAGHTVVVNGEKHVFHLLPSGCLHEGKQIILGSGMVIHLPTLLEEIQIVEKAGIDILHRLSISLAAHIVLDVHKQIDGAIEERRGEGIGTTKRGIGPTYADKAYRIGMRMENLTQDADSLKRALENIGRNAHKMFDVRMNIEEEHKALLQAKEVLGKNIENTVQMLHGLRKKGKTVLIEGAQATLLDIDHGTYPYVTSSATLSTGALHALGLPPQALTSCIGVVKSYCTRVGGGPFHTEIEGGRGDELRERGGEYGATTGRPRRCGWLDLHDLLFAAQVNGFTHLNLTKLDVLDAEESIPIFSGDKSEDLPGWQSSTSGCTDFLALPEKAQEYIEYIEKKTNLPISFIGTGPGREEMITRYTASS